MIIFEYSRIFYKFGRMVPLHNMKYGNFINPPFTSSPFLAPQEGTTHIVWMTGNGPITSINQMSPEFATETGMQRTQLLKNPEVRNIKMPKETQTIEFKVDHVQVPSDDTTYWCHVMKLPEYLSEVHHIIQVRLMGSL